MHEQEGNCGGGKVSKKKHLSSRRSRRQHGLSQGRWTSHVICLDTPALRPRHLEWEPFGCHGIGQAFLCDDCQVDAAVPSHGVGHLLDNEGGHDTGQHAEKNHVHGETEVLHLVLGGGARGSFGQQGP